MKRSTKDIILIVTIAFLVLWYVFGMSFGYVVDKNDNAKSNVVDNVFVENVSLDKSSNQLVAEFKQDKNNGGKEEIYYGRDFSIEIYQNNKWKEIDPTAYGDGLAFTLEGIRCNVNCTVEVADMDYFTSMSFKWGKKYRIVKETSKHYFYSEFHLGWLKIHFTNKNSIEKKNDNSESDSSKY